MLGALVGAIDPTEAAVRLPAVFSAHALLQRSPATPVWGWSQPGEKIGVQLGSAHAETTADANGHWRITLDLSASVATPQCLLIHGENEIAVPDVIVGDLWLSSGQSNMQFTLNATTGGLEEIAHSANSSLRWFATETKPEFLVPQEDVPGRWVIAGPDTSGDCSGVAYYFAKKLQADLQVPIGLVLTAVGGTTIQSWLSPEALAHDASLLSTLPTANSHRRRIPAPQLVPSYFYNQLIAPLTPLGLKGFIWYQGEAHFSQGAFYRQAFPLLIRDWRAHWQADLPFYFCQLPNLDRKTADAGMAGWVAEVREAQDAALSEPSTGEAVLIDVGSVDFHPLNKRVVGNRLAALAETKTYSLPGESEGPRFDALTVVPGELRVRFRNCPGGLVTHPLAAQLPTYQADSKVQGFALCGADQKWVWAQAAIEGDTVRIWSPKVSAPVATRYAWSNNPSCNLYNKAGLPAAPFRAGPRDD